MAHAFDARIDIGDAFERRWLRITVDFEDEDGEPVARNVRCLALEDEDTGEMWALSKQQAKALIHSLQDGLRVLGVPAHELTPRPMDVCDAPDHTPMVG